MYRLNDGAHKQDIFCFNYCKRGVDYLTEEKSNNIYSTVISFNI